MPIIPTSATSFSSKWRSRTSPISQSSANPGACLVEEVKWAFPYPPRPHLVIKTFIFFSLRSTTSSPVWVSFTIVPTGRWISKSGAFTPWQQLVPPFSPTSATNTFLFRNSLRVLRDSSVTRYTSHPSPPFPHRGPHFGIYFSRLQVTTPFPHWPAMTFIFTSSMNIFCCVKFPCIVGKSLIWAKEKGKGLREL